eukprot:s996_g12.t1
MSPLSRFFCTVCEDLEDCPEAQPANITTCDLEVCLEVTSDSASFDLVLEVNNETSVESVKGSAVADSLNVDPEVVSVELVNNGRRLAAMQTLEFIVEVREATKGISEFLASESSLTAVAQDVAQDQSLHPSLSIRSVERCRTH